MSEYLEELLELRAEFNTIDLQDPKAVRAWLDAHEYLSRNDIAQVAGKSKYWVAKLQIFAGIKKPTPKHKPPKSKKKIVNLEVPEDWNNREWLEKTLQLYGVDTIARAVNRHRSTIWAKIKKWGI